MFKKSVLFAAFLAVSSSVAAFAGDKVEWMRIDGTQRAPLDVIGLGDGDGGLWTRGIAVMFPNRILRGLPRAQIIKNDEAECKVLGVRQTRDYAIVFVDGNSISWDDGECTVRISAPTVRGTFTQDFSMNRIGS